MTRRIPGTRLPLLLSALAALLGAAPAGALAQVQPPAPARDTAAARPPAVSPPAVAAADSARRVSPKQAFVRSLVLPGWGQSSVGAPGRGGVYFAMEAGSLWMLLKSREKLGRARELQRVERLTGKLGEDETLGIVESREEQVEDWLTFSVFMLFFSAADAFVAAHLQDFDEHIRLGPTSTGGAGVQATVPVGGRR